MTDVQARTDSEPRHEEPAGREPAGPGAAPTRRAVLTGAGAFGATCLLAACGTAGSTGGANPLGSDYNNNPAPAGSKGTVTTGPGDTFGQRAPAGGGGAALAAVSEVPKGGGIIKGAYVITQPSAGTFKAFSKVCTHAGCDVNKVNAGVISCPCHGSTFSIEDGSVQGGPAPKGLPETKVKVSGGNVVTA
jgi:Rieske Fe-S protein